MTTHMFDNSVTATSVAAHTPAVPVQRVGADENATLTLEVTYPGQGTAVLTVTGEVDMSTTGRLRELLHCRLRSELRTLELDLSRVSFLSIAGAQMLARAVTFAQYWETELRVIATGSRAVRRVLLATGIDRQLADHIE